MGERVVESLLVSATAQAVDADPVQALLAALAELRQLGLDPSEIDLRRQKATWGGGRPTTYKWTVEARGGEGGDG